MAEYDKISVGERMIMTSDGVRLGYVEEIRKHKNGHDADTKYIAFGMDDEPAEVFPVDISTVLNGKKTRVLYSSMYILD